LIPVLAAAVLETDVVTKLPDLVRRIRWFMRKRPRLMKHLTLIQQPGSEHPMRVLLAIPTREQLVRVLRYVLDEEEFLSPYGIRSISKYHAKHPFVFSSGGQEYRVDYQPAESDTALFGGNSNWRGPIWFPINYLLIETLEIYYLFYGDELKVECPTGSGRPCHGGDPRYATDPHWKDLVLFYEYFHGDTGRGLGASHQTGWTAMVVRCFHRATERFQRFQFEPHEALPDS
jgi:glycosyl hydrolase family 63